MRKRSIVGGLLCLLWLCAPRWAQADNLVVNGDFDTEIAPWVAFSSGLALSWDAKDAANSPYSGSLRIVNTWPTDNGAFDALGQCLPLSGPSAFVARAYVHQPPGQAREANARWNVAAYSHVECAGEPVAFFTSPSVGFSGGGWQLVQVAFEVPADASSVLLHPGVRKIGDGGSVVVHLDNVSLEEDVPPPPGAWRSDSELPGFEFQVRIGGNRTGKVENGCIEETVCLSGAVAGRSEVFLRVVGPKPNGYLWPTIVKFTTSVVEVWLRQDDTGIVKYYTLRGAEPGFDELPGLFDRLGFLP